MKVNIGTYPTRLLCNIHTRHMERKYGFGYDDTETCFDNFVEGVEGCVQSVYNIFNWVWFDRRTQKVDVPVAYTNLTLATIYSVEISAGAGP